MFLEVASIVVGNILFLYIFWKRLREDYISDHIFTTFFYIILVITFSQAISKRFFPSWWFWGGFVGAITGLAIGALRFKLRIIETLEALIISAIPGMFLIFLTHFIKSSETNSLIGSFVILGIFILFFVFDKHYKRFTWYRSGRVGFSGLTIVGISFLIRAVVANSFNSVLSFAGKYEVFLSSLVAFIAFLGVFTLARQRT